MATFTSTLANTCARTFRRLTDPGHGHTSLKVMEHFKVGERYYSVTASSAGGGLYLVEVAFGPEMMTVERLTVYGEYLQKHFVAVKFNPGPVQLLPKSWTIYCQIRP
jgi:hypothetical protein